jgi:antitoxin HicB
MRQPLTYFLDQSYPFTVTSDPDGGFFISYPDLPGCITQVAALAEVGPAADEIRKLWLETAFRHGMDIPLPRSDAGYSGKFVVRLPRNLHRRLAQSAQQDGVSLNQYVVNLLATNDADQRVLRGLDVVNRKLEDIHARLEAGIFPRLAQRRAGLSSSGSDHAEETGRQHVPSIMPGGASMEDVFHALLKSLAVGDTQGVKAEDDSETPRHSEISG